MWEWLRRLVGATPQEPEEPEPSAEDPLDSLGTDGSDADQELVDPFTVDLEQLAVRADWLSERGDPRGLLINAELAGHPGLDVLVTRHLPAVLGPLLPAVEVLDVRYGQAVEVVLRRLPTAEERDCEAWANLDRIHAPDDIARTLRDARVLPGRRGSRVPQRFVPYRLVRAGLDRQLWLAYDTFGEQAVLIGVPDPHQVVEPDETGLARDRVIGAEIYPVDLEPLGPQPWSAEVAAVVGDADPAQWFLVEGEPRRLGPQRELGRPRCTGAGWAGLGSRGRMRTYDEDGFFADGERFVVLDGSGGSPRVTLGAALQAFANGADLSTGLQACHRVLVEADGMTATAVGAERIPGGFRVAWSGDPRAYRVRDDGIEQVTTDHTLVQRMMEVGRLAPEEVATHPHRFIVLRTLGYEEAEEFEMAEVQLEAGERLLLCTDGLYRALEDEAIVACVRGRAVHDAVEALVRRANAVADDNLTVVLVEGTP